jgi:hypothetical protein
MLSHSIGTFRRWFGDSPSYIVYADDPVSVASLLLTSATVLPMDISGAEYLDDRSTWKKWAPRFRANAEMIEFRVDGDWFLISEPKEILNFIAGDGHDFIITLEHVVNPGFYGNFRTLVGEDPVPINAGFFGQHLGADLTNEMRLAYEWYLQILATEESSYHAEQGALLFALRSKFDAGSVLTLSPEHYRIIHPDYGPSLESLEGVVAIHAVDSSRGHPAYNRFYDEIQQVSGIHIGG